MRLQYITKAFVATAFVLGLTACEDIFETDSDGYVFVDENTLSDPNDSLYSAMGILNQLQAIGDRYVLLGELRGDLVSVPATAPMSLQEISEFNMTNTNVYSSRSDYYKVINNCNYALAKMDTAITQNLDKVMMPEYTAIRTIRAWVYWQMALTYGKVTYVEEPVLSLEDSEKEYPEIEIDELATLLIDDLTPYVGVDIPNYGTIDGMNSINFFIPVRLLLADLHLYQNNYETAAQLYYDLMYARSYTVSWGYANYWTSAVQEGANLNNRTAYRDEAVAMIPYPSDAKKYHPSLVNMTYNVTPQIYPAAWYVSTMNLKTHYHIDRVGINTISGYLEGDTRGQMLFRDGVTEESSAYGNFRTGTTTEDLMISKFYHNAYEYSDVTNLENEMFGEGVSSRILRQVVLYRMSHLYLRYAEAVNRAGKPSLAFAVLKYGLREEVVTDSTKVAKGDLATGEAWTNFTDSRFENNYGIAMRGRGLGIAVEKTDYIIPDYTRYVDAVDSLGNPIQVPSEIATDLENARRDSILWVEERIVEEMAAETMFEGNRFFDLLRVSRHRDDHPAYMAEKISVRFDNVEAVRAHLLNKENWWLK